MRSRGTALAFTGVLCFSLTLPLTKIAARGMDPLLVAAGRTALAALLAAAVLAVRGSSVPTVRVLGRLAVVAAGVVIAFPVLTAYAVGLVPGSHAVVVSGLLPLVTAGVAVLRAGELPSGGYWLCGAIGFGAIAWYAMRDGSGSLRVADLLLLAAVVAAAVAYTEGALLARQMPGWQVISWALVIAAPVSLGLTMYRVLAGGSSDPNAGEWAAFLYIAVISTFTGFFAWYAGMARAGIAKAGQIQLAQPVLSLAWGWPLLGERLTIGAVATSGVVLAAIVGGRRATIRETAVAVATDGRSRR